MIPVTTLVCLVSAQHVPNLLTAKTIRPDRLVLVVTGGMMKNTPWFLKALAAGGLDYSKSHSIVEIQKENSVDEITRSLNAAYTQRDDDEWIINITGGTKPMSIGAYTFAQENGLRALYIVERDQHNAIDLSGGDSISLEGQHVTAAEFLAGYGYEIRNANDLKRLNQRAFKGQDLGALLTEYHRDSDIRDCLGAIQVMKDEKEKKNKKAWLREGLIITPDYPVSIRNDEVRGRIARAFGLVESGTLLTGHFERPAVEFLTGRWLEYFIYGLLLPLVPASVRCLQIGLTTGKPGPGESNEFDVSFMTERSLCMVECKTGSQKHDAKGDAVLYKMEAIKAGLGALRVKMFLATTSPNVIDPRTGDTREALTNRSRSYGCTIIHGKTLKDLAIMYRAKDPALNDVVIDVFQLKNTTSAR